MRTHLSALTRDPRLAGIALAAAIAVLLWAAVACSPPPPPGPPPGPVTVVALVPGSLVAQTMDGWSKTLAVDAATQIHAGVEPLHPGAVVILRDSLLPDGSWHLDDVDVAPPPPPPPSRGALALWALAGALVLIWLVLRRPPMPADAERMIDAPLEGDAT